MSFYSREHYRRVQGYPGSKGNPETTVEQKIQIWREMARSYANHPEVVEVVHKLIRDHGGEP